MGSRIYVEQRDGVYYVAGSRVTLDSIIQCFREGLSPEAILAEFETLSLAEVYGAIAHYLDNQPSLDAYRLLQQQRANESRRLAAPIPEPTRGKLEAA